MKKVLVTLAALFSLIFPMTMTYAKIVVGKVDIQKVLVTVQEGADVRNKLKDVFDKKQNELKQEENGIRKMQEEYQKQSLVMNAEAKANKEKDIQEKIMGIQQKSVTYQKEIQEMEDKFKKPILNRLQVIVNEVSEKAEVDVTFESSSAPVLYAKDSKDITQDVVKAYDTKYPLQAAGATGKQSVKK